MQELAVVPRDSLLPAYEQRGGISTLTPSFRGRPGLALAMRACRYRDADGVWHGLAELLRRVPETHVAPVSRLSDRKAGVLVACPCGTAQVVLGDVTECAGGCGRWMIAEGSEAWSMRVPVQDPAEQAA